MLPHRWIRRVLIAPLIPLLTLVVVTTIPLWLLIAALASPLLPGRWRPLRVLLFLIVFFVAESVSVIVLFALWIASGFGRRIHTPRWQAAHYSFMRSYLRVLVRAAAVTFNVAFDVDMDDANGPPDGTSRPLIVLSRHAGPGDSFLLVHGLLERGRHPRIVLRDTLQLVPSIDVTLNRIPNVFVSPHTRHLAARQVARQAADLGPRDALVIFPEGRNFTAQRRLRSIERLEELGRHREADEARQMRHVLTPRSGGALSAINAQPDADVVFVGHTGLENLSSVVDLWRGLPMDARVKAKVWRAPRGSAPKSRDAATTWLLGWWRMIDAWIVHTTGPDAVPDVVADAVLEGE